MNIYNFDFDTISIIKKLKNNSNDIVIYNREMNNLYKLLIQKNYISIVEEKINYNIYQKTTKIFSFSIDKILKDIIGINEETFLKKKNISIEDIPSDIDELIEALCNSDGYFEKISIKDHSDLKKALKMHELIFSLSIDDYYISGTEKLSKLYQRHGVSGIVSLLIGDLVL